MEYILYDGMQKDTTNRPNDAFFAVNSCGVSAGRYIHTPRAQGRMDWHLIYVESGPFFVSENGVRRKVLPGECVLYAPGQAQEYWQDGGVRYWCHFGGTSVQEALIKAGVHENDFLFQVDDSGMVSSFEKLIFHDATQSPLRELQLAADLMDLILQLGHAVHGSLLPEGDERLRSGILHMQKNYRSPEKPEFYAKMANLSKDRYMHLFKKNDGRFTLRIRAQHSLRQGCRAALRDASAHCRGCSSDRHRRSSLFQPHVQKTLHPISSGLPPTAPTSTTAALITRNRAGKQLDLLVVERLLIYFQA